MVKILELLGAYRSRLNLLILLSLSLAIFESLGLAILAPILSLILSGSGFLSPFIPAEFLDDRVRLITLVAVVVPALFLLKNAAIIGLRYLANNIVFSIKADLESRLFATYLGADYEKISMTDSAQASSRIMAEVQIFTFNVLQALVVIATESFILLILLAALLVYDVGLFLILVLPLILLLTPIYRLSSRKQRQWGEDNRAANEGLYSTLEIGLGAFKEIRIYGGFRHFHERFRSHARKVAHSFASSNTLAMTSLPVLETIIIVTLFGSLYYLVAIRGVPQGDIAEVIGLYGVAAVRLLPGATRLVTSVNQVKFGMRAVHSITDDLGFGRESPPPQPASHPIAFDRLEFAGVSFGYGGDGATRTLLNGLDLEIRSGQLIGIAGESGSGKSTLVGLILGLLSPSKGRMLVNGRPLSDYALADYHAMIGYVPQDVYIADGTLAENVAFGVPPHDIDNARVAELCRTLGLHALIPAETGPESVRLAGRGTSISGGQRARIGLARALYRRPQILILDEVTAGLDKATADFILKEFVLRREMELTVIMISHRMSNFAGFDELWHVRNARVERVLDVA